MNPKRGSIGPLLPMMRGRIVDPETNKDVKQGESGEMLLAGPNIMLGYLNRPEANAETLVKDAEGTTWLKTGDIARVDEEGPSPLLFLPSRCRLEADGRIFSRRAILHHRPPQRVDQGQGLPGAARRTRGSPPRMPIRRRLRRHRHLERRAADRVPSGIQCARLAPNPPPTCADHHLRTVVLSARGKAESDPSATIQKWMAGKVAHYKQLKGCVYSAPSRRARY